ncbi:hypothetical protein BH11ARM1_BH11ARM1_04720 [soil metagenome]
MIDNVILWVEGRSFWPSSENNEAFDIIVSSALSDENSSAPFEFHYLNACGFLFKENEGKLLMALFALSLTSFYDVHLIFGDIRIVVDHDDLIRVKSSSPASSQSKLLAQVIDSVLA